MKLARKVKVGILALIFAGALCGCNQDQNPSQTPAAAPSSPAAGDLKTMIPDTNRPAMPAMPAIPAMPAMPVAPLTTNLPAMPAMPVAPQITNLPTPTMPTLPPTPGYK